MTTVSRSWRVGTRASALAKAQSRWVADQLQRHTEHPVELVEVSTTGDTSSQPLTQIGGTGVFVSQLRDALVAGDIDCAVHSLKDLPTVAQPGLHVRALPARADARDVLVCRQAPSLAALPAGAKVGTGSPRRAAQLRDLNQDLQVADIRGNVDTRLRKLRAGDYDAIVLAAAGLSRLGMTEVVTQWFDVDQMIPAPGQGALAIEVRDDVSDTLPHLAAALSMLDDAATRASVTAERSLLSALEAGCSAPVGAYAVLDGFGGDAAELTLRAFVGATGESTSLRMSLAAPVVQAESAGRQLAATMLNAGVVVA